MGAADMEIIQNSELAAVKPKERQFQVVPMPGVFTRGRWKCWDYYMDREDQRKEESEKKEQMLLDFEKEKEKSGDQVVPDSMISTDVISAMAMESTTSIISTMDNISDSLMTPVKESSTFIVTSIAHAPQTPQHGTHQSQSDIMDRMKNSPMELYTQITHHESHQDSAPEMVTQTIGTIVVDSGSTQTNNGTASVTQITTIQQTTSSTQSSNAPIGGSANQSVAVEDDNASTASAPALANGAPQLPIAAIDNKIEQAMDLVKTHLTFAVREEVEAMRNTITDLEARVAFLENENQLLRSYAPTNIVDNLQQMVQNKKANSAPPASSVAPSLPPPKVPAGFCSTIFANTLNNVVAEVSREISGQPPQ